MKCANCKRASEYPVCKSCWSYALAQLDKLPQFYNDLEQELIPSSGKKSERVSGSKTPPLPVRIETLHLRTGGISTLLIKHEVAMREILNETRMKFRGEEINRITKTCEYLKDHSDWAWSNYPDLPKLAIEIIKITSKVQLILGEKSDEIVIGKCPTQDENGKPCGSTLKINPHAIDRTAEIKCRICDTVWNSTQWRLLGRVLDGKN